MSEMLEEIKTGEPKWTFEQLESVIESVLFTSQKPVTLSAFKQVFKDFNLTTQDIKKAIETFRVELAGTRRGLSIEEVAGGYQLRTKIENKEFLKKMTKERPFRLSGPALEVLSIIAYKQPVIKTQVDEIRGVESGHLMRVLMDKGLVKFAGKSDLPGKPMQYASSKKFLEIFGLNNLRGLPTLSEIDELIPEGIIEEEGEKEPLSHLADDLSAKESLQYSQGEEELDKITNQLQEISTSSEFFEEEKRKKKEKRLLQQQEEKEQKELQQEQQQQERELPTE